jgi:hypothetical protein
MSPWLESSDALSRRSWNVAKINDVFNLKQAASKVGISEGLLILWIATGKVKPSVELSATSKGLTGNAKQAFESYAGGPSEQALGWNRFVLTDEDVERLCEMVERTAVKKSQTESAHVPGSHYSVQELAALWGLGVDKIRELFANEAGVIKIQKPAKKGKQSYTTLRIPEAVAARVQKRMS